MEVVRFLEEPSLHFVHDGCRRVTREAARQRRRAQQFEIVLDGGADGRILNFDCDLVAAFGDGTMDLAQRGGGEGFRLEMTENVFRILAAGSFKLSARQGRMHAGGAHLEVGQFLDGNRFRDRDFADQLFLRFVRRVALQALSAAAERSDRALAHVVGIERGDERQAAALLLRRWLMRGLRRGNGAHGASGTPADQPRTLILLRFGGNAGGASGRHRCAVGRSRCAGGSSSGSVCHVTPPVCRCAVSSSRSMTPSRHETAAGDGSLSKA